MNMNREITNTQLDHEIHVKFIPPTSWWRTATWQLLKEYVSHNREVVVPIGFISDGATIPPFLYTYFSPTGRYFGAAIIHDYILFTENDWNKANVQFKEEMRFLSVVKWRRVLMYLAVRIWGSIRKYFPKKNINKVI